MGGLNLGLLPTIQAPETPSILESRAKGASIRSALGDIARKEEAQNYVGGHTKELNQALQEKDFTHKAVQSLMIANPEMYKYMTQAIKDKNEQTLKNAQRTADFMIGAVPYITHAESRGMTKQQAWDDYKNFARQGGVPLGQFDQMPYSDNALEMLKNSSYGVKNILDTVSNVETKDGMIIQKTPLDTIKDVGKLDTGKDGGYGQQLIPAKDKDGNTVFIQASGAGGARQVEGFTPIEGLQVVDVGGQKILYGSKTGQQKGTVQVGVSPSDQLQYSPEQQAKITGAKKQAEAKIELQAESNKKAAASTKLLPVLESAKSIINEATGSYGGALVDLAGRVVGKSTKGAENIARLKALEGQIMLTQPKMEGPQSDADVLLYRQMAAQIGDPTIPRNQKLAALDTVIKLHKQYSGQQVEKPNKPSFNVDQRAVEFLKKNPALRNEFDKKYGKGASSFYLGN